MLADSSTMKKEIIEEKKKFSESSDTSDKEDVGDNSKVSEGNSEDEEYISKETKKKQNRCLPRKCSPGAQTYDHSGDSSLSD